MSEHANGQRDLAAPYPPILRSEHSQRMHFSFHIYRTVYRSPAFPPSRFIFVCGGALPIVRWLHHMALENRCSDFCHGVESRDRSLATALGARAAASEFELDGPGIDQGQWHRVGIQRPDNVKFERVDSCRTDARRHRM